jgi:hypothetical protein
MNFDALSVSASARRRPHTARRAADVLKASQAIHLVERALRQDVATPIVHSLTKALRIRDDVAMQRVRAPRDDLPAVGHVTLRLDRLDEHADAQEVAQQLVGLISRHALSIAQPGRADLPCVTLV